MRGCAQRESGQRPAQGKGERLHHCLPLPAALGSRGKQKGWALVLVQHAHSCLPGFSEACSLPSLKCLLNISDTQEPCPTPCRDLLTCPCTCCKSNPQDLAPISPPTESTPHLFEALSSFPHLGALAPVGLSSLAIRPQAKKKDGLTQDRSSTTDQGRWKQKEKQRQERWARWVGWGAREKTNSHRAFKVSTLLDSSLTSL